MQKTAHTIDNLKALVSARRQEFSTRVFAAGLMTVCAEPTLGLPLTATWAVTYGVLQVVEFFLFWTRKPVITDLEHRGASAAFLAIMVANGVVFGAIGMIEFLHEGPWGLGYASLVLAGGMLNTVITTTGARLAFRVSIAPYMVYAGLLPVMVWFARAPPSVILMVGFGCALLGVTSLKLWSRATTIHDQQQSATRSLAKALEEAQVANRAKSAFLARMSHEIRTPLNGVLGMAHTLAADPLSPAQLQRLEIIRQSGTSLLAILNDILDLSKIEADKIELESIPFDIRSVIQNALLMFVELAASKNITLTSDLAPDADGVFCGDPTRLRQVLCNLLSNALKFTHAGEVGVAVDMRGHQLRIAVTDTGIGIAPGDLERLFRPFSQGDTSITRRFGGTGLGLAVSRELVQKMGGELCVESTPALGSCFSFTVDLPRVPDDRLAGVEGPMDAPGSLTSAAPGARGAAIRILAAEDNATNQIVLRTLLAGVGLEPSIVENGHQAVIAWTDADWDVILMDVHMPDMDGVTATRAIRAKERAVSLRRTPIIMLTADLMSDRVAGYLAAGADAVVGKPINPASLFEAITRAVREAEAPEPSGEARGMSHDPGAESSAA